jgi:hypothetical protein
MWPVHLFDHIGDDVVKLLLLLRGAYGAYLLKVVVRHHLYLPLVVGD